MALSWGCAPRSQIITGSWILVSVISGFFLDSGTMKKREWLGSVGNGEQGSELGACGALSPSPAQRGFVLDLLASAGAGRNVCWSGQECLLKQ